MISVHFQGKPFNITVIQVYPPTSNAKEAEVEWFCDDLQDLFVDYEDYSISSKGFLPIVLDIMAI